MISKSLLRREAEIEARSYELDLKLRAAKQSNNIEIIKEIEEEIKQNDIAFEILMVGINAELEGGYY